MNRSSNIRMQVILPLSAALSLAACAPPAPPDAGHDPQSPPEDVAAPTPSDVAGTEPAEPIAGARTASASTATAELKAASDSEAGGTLAFAQDDGFLHITGEINGLSPGVHGLHVHEIGDCSAPDASSAGDHYAPRGSQHGAPTQTDELHHAGDLGNIVADGGGRATVDAIDDGLTLSGPETIVGRAIVVHADPDDLVSQPSGNSGDRVACGVVESGAAGGDTA